MLTWEPLSYPGLSVIIHVNEASVAKESPPLPWVSDGSSRREGPAGTTRVCPALTDLTIANKKIAWTDGS